MHVLFVCTGNTCRSSMAEAIFRSLIGKSEAVQGKVTCSSAGIMASYGQKASSHAVQVVEEEWGIDLGGHCSKMIEENDIRNADIILTMTSGHKRAIVSAFPEAAHKVSTLKEYVGIKLGQAENQKGSYVLDIMDPYGMPKEVYRQCAYEIKDALIKLVEKLKANQ